MTEPTPLTRAELKAAQSHGRAGRNLPLAIAVGCGLGAVAIAALFIQKEFFLSVIAIMTIMAIWEMAQGLQAIKVDLPLIPVMIGSFGMVVAAFSAGGQALAVCCGLTCLGMTIWRSADGFSGALPDIAGGVLVIAYIPLLTSFVALMLADNSGAVLVFCFILTTVCSDIGGYAAGVLFGKHPMAPSVSPKKSWEGFLGSVIAASLAAIFGLWLLLEVPAWGGLLFGVVLVAGATLGDLCESLIKRDLGIKDMGAILPGHGGILDRIDSIIVAAPLAWLLYQVIL